MVHDIEALRSERSAHIRFQLCRAAFNADYGPQTQELLQRNNMVRGELMVPLRRGLSSIPCPTGANLRQVIEARSQSTTGTEGGHTVPASIVLGLETGLLAASAMRRAGTVFRSDTGRTINWPNTDDTATDGQIIGENSTLPALVDLVFGTASTTPFLHGAGPLVLSQQLRDDAFNGFLEQVGLLLGKRLGRGQENVFVNGTGTGESRGLLLDADDSGVSLAAANNPTTAELLSIWDAVDDLHAEDGSWLFSRTVLKNIIARAEATGNSTIWRPPAAGSPGLVFDRPYYVSTKMPTAAAAKSIVFGDLSKYLIHDAGEIEVREVTEIMDQLPLSHQVAFIAHQRTDGVLLDAGTSPVVYAVNP